jgi:hypothetical protein
MTSAAATLISFTACLARGRTIVGKQNNRANNNANRWRALA